jgi:DNA-binding NarL/FixJ family response regulator
MMVNNAFKEIVRSIDSYGEREYYLPLGPNGNCIAMTIRETIVINLLIKGFRAKQIAWKVETTLNTVHTHMSRIKEKLHCKSIFDLGWTLGLHYSALERELASLPFIAMDN